MGRSRGGLSSKIHAVVDTNGLPVQLALTAGEAHDNRLASKLLSRLKSGTMLLADRGYDADWIRALTAKKGVWANIPPKCNRNNPNEAQSDGLVKANARRKSNLLTIPTIFPSSTTGKALKSCFANSSASSCIVVCCSTVITVRVINWLMYIDTSIVRVHQHGACVTRNRRTLPDRHRWCANLDCESAVLAVAFNPGHFKSLSLAVPTSAGPACHHRTDPSLR